MILELLQGLDTEAWISSVAALGLDLHLEAVSCSPCHGRPS